MRITFILPVASRTGGVRVVAIYAERLRRRGHEVTVVSRAEHAPLLRRFKDLVRGARADAALQRQELAPG